jgi:hypothetical protein
MAAMSFPVSEGRFGFEWGPANICRLHSDPKHGVWIEVSGQHERIEIRVTKAGRIRVSKPKKNPKDYFKGIPR